MEGMGAQGVYTPPSKKREMIRERERERLGTEQLVAFDEISKQMHCKPQKCVVTSNTKKFHLHKMTGGLVMMTDCSSNLYRGWRRQDVLVNIKSQGSLGT
jgi:hypothetical protein